MTAPSDSDAPRVDRANSAPAGRGWITAAILVPYLVSMALPAITGHFENAQPGARPDTALGCMALVIGWIALLFGTVAWLANPFLWTGLGGLRRGRARRAAGFGIAASACALATLLVTDWTCEIGYFFWLASMFLLTGFAVITRSAEASSAQQTVSPTPRLSPQGKEP